MAVQFVSAILASATVRLSLDSGPWRTRDGSDLSPPDVQYALAGTLLMDGETIAASAYDNRTLSLKLQLDTQTVEEGLTQVQALARELNRPSNILKWHPKGATHPVFFRTFRTGVNAITEHRGDGGNLRGLTVDIPAEPFALGLLETVTAGGFPFVVSNDVASPVNGCFFDCDFGPSLTADSGFETASLPDWTLTGGTKTRDGTQQHSGSFSGKVVPDGVTSLVKLESTALSAATVGAVYIASAWVRCEVARTVDVNILWHDSGFGFLSTSSGSRSVAANTWTQIQNRFTAPANAVFAKIQIAMAGTPPASHVLYVDEGVLAKSTPIKGDVETPAILTIDHTDVNTKGPTAISIRRRGTPSATPFRLTAEGMTAGTDTSLQSNDAVMSGSGSNYMKTTFATVTTMADRITSAIHPSSASVDARGTYRVFVRWRRSSATGTISLQLRQTSGTTNVDSTAVATGAVTSRRWIEVGQVQIPFGADPVSDGFSGSERAARGTVYTIRAERSVAGSDLDLDEIVLMPADDDSGFCIITWPSSSGPTSDVIDGPRDHVYPVGSNGEVYPREHIQRTGPLPMLSSNQDNRIFMLLNAVGASGVNDDITSAVDVTLSYYPRYLYVRPAAT